MALSELAILGIIGAASGLLGMGANFGQQGWSQAYSAAEAEKNRQFTANQNALDRQFNAAQAQLQRDFTERMSSTAYQRLIQDLDKAGVNPSLLMGGASIANTSGVAASHSTNASVSSPSPGVPNAGNAFSSAMSAAIAKTVKDNRKETFNNFYDYLDDIIDVDGEVHSSALSVS